MENTRTNTREEEAYRAEVRHKYATASVEKNRQSSHRIQQFIGLIIFFVVVISISVYSIFNFGSRTSTDTLNLPDDIELNEETGEDKVSLDNLIKGFNDNSLYPQITFALTFANNTDKSMKGFEGVVTFFDIFDNEIEPIKFSYDGGLPSRYEVTIEKAIDYNQFMDSRVKLKDTEMKNLTYKWKVMTIVYEDGTKETY